MGFLDRLTRFVTEGPQQRATAAMREAYLDAVRRTRALAQHAEQAPQDYSVRALEELAEHSAAQVSKLADALRAAGAPVPPDPVAAPSRRGLNHWARVVDDLEAHQRAIEELQTNEIQFAADLPAVAQLFRDLVEDCTAQTRRLRTQIARADAQALN